MTQTKKSKGPQKLPILTSLSLFCSFPLAALGKLYRGSLACEDKCCMADDKSLHSIALSRSCSFGPLPRPVPGRFIVQIEKLRSFAPRTPITMSKCSLASFAFGTLVLIAQAWGAIPSDRLMPAETQGFASVADVNLLIDHWHQTQLGQLVEDEAMRPFVEEMKDQFERNISGLKEKLAISYTDLSEIAGGEVAIGMSELPGARAALSATVDTTGRHRQLETLLAKVDKELAKIGATKSTVDHDGTTFVTFDIPPQEEGDIARQTIYFVKDNMLCASDNAQQLNEMFQRFEQQTGGLAGVQTYQITMERCQKEAGSLKPEMRWYVNPFGYARTIHSLEPADAKQKGKDYVKILREQGFDAIQAMGGYVNLSVDNSFELVHRTAIYAPAISGEQDKYKLAMRMMKFPNQTQLTANKWMPRQLATYRTFSCDLNNAFQYFGTLFDAIAGYEDAFDGVLEGLERDPYGPRVDVQKDFVSHLGERVMLVTDYQLPITPKCERFMIVVELKNEQAVAATVEKFMKSDPNASSSEFEGKQIWEIHEAEADIPEIDIAVGDLDLLDEAAETTGEDGMGASALASSAVCVWDSHLFIASHAEFLKDVLAVKNQNNKLEHAGDFQEVERVMTELLAGPISAKFFVRTDEAYRPIYDLIRQGKMPEAETLLGRVLNRMLTPPESEDEGILREQKIDGRKLPDFEMVRRYFGPAGTVVRSDEDGWFVVGATLSKQATQARANSTQLSSDGPALR
jgi:hypothetical protein